jgi:hypothetical protein
MGKALFFEAVLVPTATQDPLTCRSFLDVFAEATLNLCNGFRTSQVKPHEETTKIHNMNVRINKSWKYCLPMKFNYSSSLSKEQANFFVRANPDDSVLFYGNRFSYGLRIVHGSNVRFNESQIR